jgi:arylsulfatase A-like enzyme
MSGAGAAAATLLGAPAVLSGCGTQSNMNVILIIVDSLRKDHVGAYGNSWIRTPNLDALAAESLRFTRPYPESIPTIPARRAIHTGMRTFSYPKYNTTFRQGETNFGWFPIPEDQTTLAEILSQEGYNTLAITDTYVQFPMSFDRGFDEFRSIRGQENDRYKDPDSVSQERMDKYLPIQESETRQHLANTQGRKNEKDWFAPKVFLGASDLLEGARDKQPFFLTVDCFDPHEPWDTPDEYIRLYESDDYDGREPFTPIYGKENYLTDRQLTRMRALYAAEVTMMDRWLGEFMQKARDLDVLDNTLVILLSDHGHLLGEHGYTGKSKRALWPELTDIAYLVRHPEGKRAGETSDYYASTHDVSPTILSMLGVNPPVPMQGQDLSVLFNGKDPEPRNHFASAYGDHVWCRDEEHSMFCRIDKTDFKLYNLRTDKDQIKNIAADQPDIADQMFEDYVRRST